MNEQGRLQCGSCKGGSRARFIGAEKVGTATMLGIAAGVAPLMVVVCRRHPSGFPFAASNGPIASVCQWGASRDVPLISLDCDGNPSPKVDRTGQGGVACSNEMT